VPRTGGEAALEDISKNEEHLDLARTGRTSSHRARHRKYGECARAGGNADSYVDGNRYPDPDEYAVAEQDCDAYAYRHIRGHPHVDRDAQGGFNSGS